MLATSSVQTHNVPYDCREDGDTRRFLDTVILFLEVTGDVASARACMTQWQIRPDVQARILQCLHMLS